MKVIVKTRHRRSHPLVIPISLTIIGFSLWKVYDELLGIVLTSDFWIRNPLGLGPTEPDSFWLQLLPAAFYAALVIGGLALLIHALRNHSKWGEEENTYKNVVSYQASD